MAAPAPVDRSEIEELYRKYGALVRRRARGILGDDAEAQDAMQEVFVRVIGSMGEFRGQSQPSTWLYRITTNLCLNRIRDSKRRRARLAQLGESAGETQGTGFGVTPWSELRGTVRAVLHALPIDLAEIGVYYYVDEMDQAEIAALLGVSRRTIGYRLDRFREEAMTLLEGAKSTAAKVHVGGQKGQGGQES